MENPGPSSAVNYRISQRVIEHNTSRALLEENKIGEETFKDFHKCPDLILIKIFEKLPVSDLKNCRLTCIGWNAIIVTEDLLNLTSCFLFDGRRDDSAGGKCAEYFTTSETKNLYWTHIRFRRIYVRQTNWLFHYMEDDLNVCNTITHVELVNCSMNWTVILQFLMYLPNVNTFVDRQDMYCWDYQTFNAGIDEDEVMENCPSFINIKNHDNVDYLANLRFARIHRSQLVECTTYLKMFMLRCESLKELEVTTDQNFAPQRANSFYINLFNLMQKNKNSLKILRFPFKLISPTYDFRVMDEHHCFREFLNHVTERRWFETLRMPVLEELQFQFGIIPVDNQDLKTKLIPVLMSSFPNLKRFLMGCCLLESGMERFVEEFFRELHHSTFKTGLGMYLNDAAGLPNTLNFQPHIRSLSVQTFRDMARQIKELVPLLGIQIYENLKEFQYFSKNHSFRNYNMDLLTESFRNLTNLNLVDHNSRLETRHSCEAWATIEDEDMQLIITRLQKLESLQLIANMTYLTDSGLTGINLQSCKRMYSTGQFVLSEGDTYIGRPVSHLKSLRSLVLRGLGIKVTDVTANFGFNDMTLCKKLHLYGCHQLSVGARSSLGQKFNISNGCDLQIGAS